MEQFDLIIIGGGPAGYTAGERASRAGLATAVIEQAKLGGVCLHDGCIPTKAYLNSAKIYEYAAHGEAFGVTTTGASISHGAVYARKNKVVKQLMSALALKLKRAGVTVIQARARIAGKDGELFRVETDDAVYTAPRLLIASGSEPTIPPLPGIASSLESGFAVTSTEILELSEVPERLVVVGGGVVGLETANYFAVAGSDVTLVTRSAVSEATDADITNILLKSLKNKGIEFGTNCDVMDIADGRVTIKQNGEIRDIEADKVLVAIGRRPLTDGLGLETIGVNVERRAIVTDECLRTNVPNVYAAGDVNGLFMLAHTAYREAEVAVNHMTGKSDAMRYNAIPFVMYTNPEVASVGETKESAQKLGMDVKTLTIPLKYSGRYVAEAERGDGICKFVMDKPRGCLIGVHMVGSYASEIIYGATMMIDAEMPVDRLKEVVFPHPTVCEVLREGLFELK